MGKFRNDFAKGSQNIQSEELASHRKNVIDFFKRKHIVPSDPAIDGEDIINEAIVKLQEAINEGSTIRKVGAWLHRVAMHLFIDKERQWKRRRTIPLEIEQYSQNQTLLDKCSFDKYKQLKNDSLYQNKIDKYFDLLQSAVEDKLNDEDRKLMGMMQSGQSNAEIAGEWHLDKTDQRCIDYVQHGKDLLRRKLRYHCCSKSKGEKTG